MFASMGKNSRVRYGKPCFIYIHEQLTQQILEKIGNYLGSAGIIPIKNFFLLFYI
jgi:effector-binding domain-containing protein